MQTLIYSNRSKYKPKERHHTKPFGNFTLLLLYPHQPIYGCVFLSLCLVLTVLWMCLHILTVFLCACQDCEDSLILHCLLDNHSYQLMFCLIILIFNSFAFRWISLKTHPGYISPKKNIYIVCIKTMKLNLGLYKSAGINGFTSNTLQFNYIIKIASFFFHYRNYIL